MAFIVARWDLPGTSEAQEKYAAKAPEWLNITLTFPGFVATRILRNPYNATPQVCAVQEFESLERAQAWMISQENANLNADMRAHGCSNMTMELWDTSPLAPNLLRANTGD